MDRAARKGRLLSDSNVRRWHENLARGSPITADVYLRRLALFCEQNNVDPNTLVTKEPTFIEDLLSDHVGLLEKSKKSPSYVAGVLKAVRSWLDYKGVQLKRKIKISNSGSTPTIENEKIPEKEELKNILGQGDSRVKASEVLIGFAGLRPETIGNYRGDDGLKISDFLELVIENNHIKFKKIPTLIVVRPSLSKARHKYITFLNSEGCSYLKHYLDERLAKGENFDLDTPVISVKPGYDKKGYDKRGLRFVKTANILDDIRKAIRVNYSWRPYVLRAYFDTMLMLAESKGKISHSYRVFFMGHKGDMEARYTTNKGRLPEDVIEDMRASFKECEEYLSTRRPTREEDPEFTTLKTMVESGVLDLSKPNVKQYLMQKLGIQDMNVRVAKMKESGYSEDEGYVRVICGELGIEPMKIEAFKTFFPAKARPIALILPSSRSQDRVLHGAFLQVPLGTAMTDKSRFLFIRSATCVIPRIALLGLPGRHPISMALFT